jgi:hypothetical protein
LRINTVIWLAVCLSLGALPAAGQAAEGEDHGTLGIAASLQGSHTGLVFPIWVSSRMALTPTVSLLYVEDAGTDWSVGIGARHVMVTRYSVYPYIALGVNAVGYSPKSDETIVDYVFALAYGGEYFLARQFSLGMEIQVNITKSDKESNRFSNPGGANVNTATQVYATLYFK